APHGLLRPGRVSPALAEPLRGHLWCPVPADDSAAAGVPTGPLEGAAAGSPGGCGGRRVCQRPGRAIVWLRQGTALLAVPHPQGVEPRRGGGQGSGRRELGRGRGLLRQPLGAAECLTTAFVKRLRPVCILCPRMWSLGFGPATSYERCTDAHQDPGGSMAAKGDVADAVSAVGRSLA
ncbi:unnamed protein product, partial [Ixodes pacificus]